MRWVSALLFVFFAVSPFNNRKRTMGVGGSPSLRSCVTEGLRGRVQWRWGWRWRRWSAIIARWQRSARCRTLTACVSITRVVGFAGCVRRQWRVLVGIFGGLVTRLWYTLLVHLFFNWFEIWYVWYFYLSLKWNFAKICVWYLTNMTNSSKYFCFDNFIRYSAITMIS